MGVVGASGQHYCQFDSHWFTSDFICERETGLEIRLDLVIFQSTATTRSTEKADTPREPNVFPAEDLLSDKFVGQ